MGLFALRQERRGTSDVVGVAWRFATDTSTAEAADTADILCRCYCTAELLYVPALLMLHDNYFRPSRIHKQHIKAREHLTTIGLLLAKKLYGKSCTAKTVTPSRRGGRRRGVAFLSHRVL